MDVGDTMRFCNVFFACCTTQTVAVAPDLPVASGRIEPAPEVVAAVRTAAQAARVRGVIDRTDLPEHRTSIDRVAMPGRPSGSAVDVTDTSAAASSAVRSLRAENRRAAARVRAAARRVHSMQEAALTLGRRVPVSDSSTSSIRPATF
jgi:hypothetical protein